MSRRELPARSTRGQKPVINEEQAIQDNQIYENLFGNNLDDDEDYEQKKKLEEQCKNMMILNIRNFCYSRGYHYFFPLDKFQRLEGHPSYAVDQDNVFQSTYSQESKQYLESTLSDLINRKYIGLPSRSSQKHQNKEELCKNICHSYLFDNEDKKYHMVRNIYTLKKVYQNLDHLIANDKLGQFKLLKTDFDLKILFTKESSFQEKKEALRKRIIILEEKKESMTSNWYSIDKAFFHHSLNQILHNNIAQLKEQMSGRQIISMLLGNHYFFKAIIQRDNNNIIPFLKSAFLYYNSDKLALSEEYIDALQERVEHLTKVDSEGEPIFLFPAQVFSFGSSELMQTVNRVLAARIFKRNESTYYITKLTWRRLFQSDLIVSKKGQEKSSSLEDYNIFAQKLIDDARYKWENMPQNLKQRQQNDYPSLDELINFDQIVAPVGQTKILTLKKTGEIAIQVKDFVIITLYDWICKGFNVLFPLLKDNREFEEMMYSDNFNKLSHQIVSIVQSPIAGTLLTAIQMLCDCLSRPSTFEQLDITLNFQLVSDKRVGIVWKVQKDEEVWETESDKQDEEDEEDQDNDDDEDSEDSEDSDEVSKEKKVKEDQVNEEVVKQNCSQQKECIEEDQGLSPSKKQKL